MVASLIPSRIFQEILLERSQIRTFRLREVEYKVLLFRYKSVIYKSIHNQQDPKRR